MIFFRAISCLPFPVLYFCSWLAYLLLYYVTGYRKAVVRQNLRSAFPEKSAREITVLAKKFYRHLADMAFEIIKARRMSQADFLRRAKVVNPEFVAQRSNNGKNSLIILTIHQGNWEWMLHGSIAGLKVPMDPVYKPLHNKTVDQLIFDIRSQFGARPLTMKESTRDILRRRKEFRLFVMVADQSPIRSERSHWATFMNQEAAFYLGAEAIANLTRFPVLFAQCRTVSRGHYEIEYKDVALPPYDKDSHAITERYVELAEAAIRAEPETWLWSNRRWKRDRALEEESDASEQAPA